MKISVIVNASVHVHNSKGLYIDLDMNGLWLSQKLKKINAKQNKKKCINFLYEASKIHVGWLQYN